MSIDESLPIEVTRGGMVESRHAADVVAVNASGEAIVRRGDTAREIYARSSAKPLQALPLIESGAAERFGLDDARIALACASHTGQTEHTGEVRRWLGDIGLSEDALECGPHRPSDLASADALVAAGEAPTRIHNNCSGKHTGFLTTAVHLGEDHHGYIGLAHPVQQRLLEGLGEMSGCDLSATHRGSDGCGIPVIGVPLIGLARAMARMADPAGLGPVREAACRRIPAAMNANPLMVAGNGVLDTDLMRALPGIATKRGAEGVQIAIVPEKGLGIAIKAHCGNERASEAALLWVLQTLGLIGASAREALAERIVRPVFNTLNERVGEVRAGIAE